MRLAPSLPLPLALTPTFQVRAAPRPTLRPARHGSTYLLRLYLLLRCARRFDVCAHVRGINADIAADDPSSTSSAKRKTWTTPLWAERDLTLTLTLTQTLTPTLTLTLTLTLSPNQVGGA